MPKYVKPGNVAVGPHTFSTDVKSVLETPALLPYYRKFMSSHFAQNMIDFLIAVREKKDPQFIVQNFIEKGGKQALNIRDIECEPFKDLFANPVAVDDRRVRVSGLSDWPESDWPEKEDDENPRSPNDPDYFKKVEGEIRLLLDRGHGGDFLESKDFEDFCFSVIGKPDALAEELGVTSSADVESLGQLMIAVEVRNAGLIKTIAAELAAQLGTDAKTLVLQLAGQVKAQKKEIAESKLGVEDWKERLWANGSFTIAVRQFLEARLVDNKKAMGTALDTAHSIASFTVDKGITKKMVASEISVYAKRQARAEPVEPTAVARPDLDISLVPKVNWEYFTKLYDMEAEDAAELQEIAKILVKHGEDRALTSSRKLHQKSKKSKKSKVAFKNERHMTAAIKDMLRCKKEGTKPQKALKASEIPDD